MKLCKHKHQQATHDMNIGYQWCLRCKQKLYKWHLQSGRDLIPPEILQNNEEFKGEFQRGGD